MTSVCFKRLQRELVAIQKNPVENISTTPNENNLLEWHYVIEGPPGSVYEGGFYHGVLKFPKEYPYKPPSILMFTRNGRFKQNVRLCLSMSDYHPETWNPMWSVSSILSGLMSFMLDSQSTLGSIEAPDELRRQYARQSLSENLKNPVFRKLFPQYVTLSEEMRKSSSANDASRKRDSSVGGVTESLVSSVDVDEEGDEDEYVEAEVNIGNENRVVAARRTSWAQVFIALFSALVAGVAVTYGVLMANSSSRLS